MDVTRAAGPDTLRRRTSEKWASHPSDVLPMFIAETDFPLAPPIAAALHEAVDLGDTGYVRFGDAGVFEAFAGFAADTWNWRPDPDGMAVTTDVSVVIVEALRRLVAPGDGVIIMPPVYPPFFDLLPEAGATVVEVPLLDDATDWSMDLAGIDAAMAAGAAGVLLCHPHNPLGLVHGREQLEQLAAIVERHGGFVVSDEIHAPLTHRGVEFVPYLSVSPAAANHGIAAESGSKAFNLAGLKTALFVTASEPMATLVGSLPAEVTYRAGQFGLIATRVGFSRCRDWLAGTIASIESNVDLLRTELASSLPAVTFRRPAASYLAWLDMRALGWGDDPAQVALERAGVALSSGPTFGRPGNGFARMNLGCAPDTIADAVGRLARAAG